MFRNTKYRVAAAASVCAMAVGAGASTASAQGPVITGGLVNVTVFDVANNNNVSVQLPIGVAANVCGVDAVDILSGGDATVANCDATVQQLPRAFQ